MKAVNLKFRRNYGFVIVKGRNIPSKMIMNEALCITSWERKESTLFKVEFMNSIN